MYVRWVKESGIILELVHSRNTGGKPELFLL